MAPWLLTSCDRGPSYGVLPDLPQRAMGTPEAEASCNRSFYANEKGHRVSWKGHVPVVMSFDVAFPPDFVVAVKAAMATWNKAAGYELFRPESAPRPPSLPGEDGRNTFYYLNEDGRAPGLRAALGRTSPHAAVATSKLLWYANQLEDADVVFNGIDSSLSTSRVHAWSYDVEKIALHELGHVLGLKDNFNPLSTMFFDALLPLGFSLRYLDATSIALLRCEY